MMSEAHDKLKMMGSVLLHPEARYDLLQYFAMQYFPRKLHFCEGKNVFLYTIIGQMKLFTQKYFLCKT